MTDLWHYTCEHGRRGIGSSGVLLPGAILMPHKAHLLGWQNHFVWLTDLDDVRSRRARRALGLTDRLATCQRMIRYAAHPPSGALPWVDFREHLTGDQRADVEQAPGVQTAHWWVSALPVPVELAPYPSGLPCHKARERASLPLLARRV